MTFFDTIRGVEVVVHAEEFDGDDSVGIPFGPGILYAKRLDDDSDFELTDEETEKLTITATDNYYDNDPAYD